MPRVSTCMGTESEHEVLSSLHRYRHSAGRGSRRGGGRSRINGTGAPRVAGVRARSSFLCKTEFLCKTDGGLTASAGTCHLSHG